MKRAAKDRHAVDRLKERYDIALDAQGREEILGAIRKCKWTPLELQGSRLKVLLRHQGQIIEIVFETTDLALVTALPFSAEHLTPEQFERASRCFPELAKDLGAKEALPSKFPAIAASAAKPQPVAVKPVSVDAALFDLVLVRFGRDKKKADLWWNTPNHELGGESPAALEAKGKAAKVESYLARAKLEKKPLRIPERRLTADLDCKRCHGYPPPEQACGLCEDR